MEQIAAVNMAPPPPGWVTITEASERFQLSVKTLGTWSREGRFPAIKGRGPSGLDGRRRWVWFLSPDAIHEALSNPAGYSNIPHTHPALLSPETIHHYPNRAQLLARIVAAAYEVPLCRILGPTRLPAGIEARRVLLVLLEEMPALYGAAGFATTHKWGITEIGRMMGRDHSTCCHNREQIITRPTPEETAMLTECRSMVRHALIAQVQRRKERKAAPVLA